MFKLDMEKPVKKVLAVICTFNPEDKKYNNSFEDFSHPWFNAIRSWQMQRSENLDVDIVIADDVSGPKTRAKLIEFQKRTKDFYIDFIDKLFSSQFVGFNHALSLFKDKYYDYYSYCASDTSFCNKGDLKVLLNDINDSCGFISPQADNDMVPRFIFNKKKPPTRIRLGGVVNTHLGIWTREFIEAYDYKYVDILGGPRSEEFYPYLCAAIRRQEFVSHRVCVHHAGAHDRCNSYPLLSIHYKRDFYKMLNEGVKKGLGFEECLGNTSIYWDLFLNMPRWSHLKMLIIKIIGLNPIVRSIFNSFNRMGIVPKRINYLAERVEGKPYCHKHNPNCFDENEYPKTDELYHFIKENLFLKKNELDYEKIPFQFYVPNQSNL